MHTDTHPHPPCSTSTTVAQEKGCVAHAEQFWHTNLRDTGQLAHVCVMVNPLLACTSLKQNRLGERSHTHEAEMGAGKQFTHCSNSWLKPGVTSELAPMKPYKKPYRSAAFSIVTAKSTLQQRVSEAISMCRH